MVTLGYKDHLGHQDQRDFPVTLVYQDQMDHLDQRVCKAPEDHKGHQVQRELRGMKDRLAQLAMLVLLEDLEGKGILGNLVQMVSWVKKETWEILEKLVHKVLLV